MGQTRQRYDWDRTAAVMALIANCHRDPKTDPFDPSDFHPLSQRDRSEEVLKLDAKHSIDVLASFLVGSGNGRRE